MASTLETLKSATSLRAKDKEMDKKMTPEQLVQDIKDDLDLLVQKLKGIK